MSTSHQDCLRELVARYAAIEATLSRTPGARWPRYARSCAALVALGARDEPAKIAARTGELALALRGARGVNGAVKSIFAAALAVANRRAEDYLAARASLLPALRDRRASLPFAALAYALAARTTIGAGEHERIRAIAPIAVGSWWTGASRWNGFFAAALALRGETPETVEARLDAARRALHDVGAPGRLARDDARRVVLAGADPAAAARTWRRLDDMRRTLRPKPRRDLLLSYAARVADAPGGAEAAATVFADALAAANTLRPRPHSLVRPALAAGFAVRALAPESGAAALDLMEPIEAVALVMQAQAAATAAAGGAAAAASASG